MSRSRFSNGRWLLVAGALLLAGLAAFAAPADKAVLSEPGETVKIVFQTVPPVDAVVRLGKKKLGVIVGSKKRPLVIVRPKDSEPLDIVIRANGYLPVHTRAYTFTDTKLLVKLTPVEEKNTLFGYREELPGDGGAQDASPTPAPSAPFGPPLLPPPADAGVRPGP